MDETDKKQCQGVAGLGYFCGMHITEPLPDIHVESCTEKGYELYARLTNDAEEHVKHYKSKACCIAAFAIRVGSGDGPWGVITLDSPDAHALTKEHIESPKIKQLRELVAALIKEFE